MRARARVYRSVRYHTVQIGLCCAVCSVCHVYVLASWQAVCKCKVPTVRRYVVGMGNASFELGREQ